MSKLENLKQHVYLFDMMAEKLGRNLEVAIIEEKIAPEEVVEAAFRCSDCDKAATCAASLPQAGELKQPFEYCRNQALFARIGAKEI